ncbi:hypothetical protein SLEP1_g17300 [Rubroshorea leprosula]|uniref:Uncharacterized protein n=1 Tax=Rubroshorea leprosula TaxID=152421 RepID=A0AAV5J308_9ROSI|nr:hypothetical protein SLEP1_g17300 [Rubroshorea leprosula]
MNTNVEMGLVPTAASHKTGGHISGVGVFIFSLVDSFVTLRDDHLHSCASFAGPIN